MAEETKILSSSVKSLGKHLKEGWSPWVPSTQAPLYFCWFFSFQFKKGCWHFLLIERRLPLSLEKILPWIWREIYDVFFAVMGYCVYSSLLSLSKARTSLWVLRNVLSGANCFPWEGRDYNKEQILKKIKFPGRSLSINLQVIFPHSPLGIMQTELCPALVTNVPGPDFRNKA